MSVAWIDRLLHSTQGLSAGHRRTVETAAVVLAATALGFGFSLAALSGLAVVAALLASLAAVMAWHRVRAVARSYEAMTLAVMDLTLRLAQVEAAATWGRQAPVAIGAGMPAAGDITTDPAVDQAAGMTTGDRLEQAPVRAVDELPVIALPGPAAEPAPTGSAVPDDDPAGEPGDLSALALADGGDPGESPIPVAATATETRVPEGLPSFALTSLRGDTVTNADVEGQPAVVVFWRPGCDHSRRLTPELAAWESLQGPRLIVVAACDGPTAFRASLPGMVILDPAFSVGQALGAPGTPAALPIDAGGRPTGPLATGASAVTTLLLDAMRDWGSAETEPDTDVDITVACLADDPGADATAGEPVGQSGSRPPTVLLRRVGETTGVDTDADPDWDTEPVTRRVG